MSYVHTKMISKNGIADGYMASDAFVETAVSKYPEGGGEVLFPVQTLVLEGVEFWV
jgi:hypothetical protein